MTSISEQLEAATASIRTRWDRRPRIGIILGTGLGKLARQIECDATLPYDTIPHFPRSTAPGHRGQLCCGQLEGLPVVTMEGRFHRYEGYSLAETTFPVRIMKRLGIELLIISNASGGMNPHFRSGEIMVIEDHINLMCDNPLVGINHEQLGPKYPDMSNAYDPTLIDRVLKIARREDIVVHRGTYVAVSGPNYETRAEYRYLRKIGGDVVGMSTVPEVVVAAHEKLRVLALSTITNICLPDVLEPTSAEEVVHAAETAEQNMVKLVRGILAFEAARIGTGLPR